MRSSNYDRTEAVFCDYLFRHHCFITGAETPMITNQKDLRRAFWLDPSRSEPQAAQGHLLHRYARCVRRLCRLMRARRHHSRLWR